jgi:hypothetical protein
VVLLDILGRRWWLLAIVWRRRSACPLIGAWQTIWLLVLVLRMLGHVGAGLLGRWRWRWERGVHMRRLRIRAIRGLLGSGRLPVGGKLALATLVREHVLGCVVELGGWWMAGATGSCHGALSQCNTAAGLLSVCCGRGRVQGLWARASGGWWCGKCSGAGEVSQNTGKSGPQRRLQESETMGRAGGRVGGIALGRERV